MKKQLLAILITCNIYPFSFKNPIPNKDFSKKDETDLSQKKELVVNLLLTGVLLNKNAEISFSNQEICVETKENIVKKECITHKELLQILKKDDPKTSERDLTFFLKMLTDGVFSYRNPNK